MYGSSPYLRSTARRKSSTNAESSAHGMAPVREARQAERQPRSQFGSHCRIGVLCVAAPVQRIPLTAGPRAARPNDALAGRRFRRLEYRLVVAQRVEVVLVPAGAHGVI